VLSSLPASPISTYSALLLQRAVLLLLDQSA
jgi:hypothetical protein